MNRKNLTAAVLAGLAGAAGIAGTAQAVNLNPDGLGQVLIYPYYTTNGGNFTLLSVVNTTDHAKAVKVRFLEGMNSREVLDFNLYLSAYDVWAAGVITDGSGRPAVTTEDNSCTVPGIVTQADMTQEFLTLAYAGGQQRVGDGGPTGIDRATEGHFEMIEMGTMIGGSAAAATHAGGVPSSCATLVSQWSVTNGVDGAWLDDANFEMEAPSGGLFGGAAVVNVGNGTMYSYDARAVEGFSTVVNHFEPGNERPSLDDGDVFVAYMMFDENGDGVPIPYADGYARGVDAVSAVFMHDAIMNEYSTEDRVKALSEWVVTFPTKRFYTDPVFAPGAPIAPFTSVWSDNDGDTVYDGACEIIRFGPGEKGIWDREEDTLGDDPQPSDDPVFSPSEGDEPPPVPTSSLCFETNVIRFGALPQGADPDTYAGPTEILGSNRVLNVNNDALGFENGWLSLDLFVADDPNTQALEDPRYLQGLGGLPVTGFWLLGFQNGYLGDANTQIVANYGGIFNHKATRCLEGGCERDALPDPQ